MQPLPAWVVERPKRSRQYVIGKRRCRQRTAQLLGAGVPIERAAAIERRSEAELLLLLQDEGFTALVDHYRRFAELPDGERLAELRRLALDLLHLALRAGDLRAAVFFLNEQRRGRDPATSLAQAAIAKARRTAGSAAAPPERRLPPKAPAEPPRREADFAYCAATQPSETHAAALAAREAAAFPARTAATRHRLATRLLAEAERDGTATRDALTGEAEAFGRDAHGKGGEALTAAAEWQERRDAFATGRVAEGQTDGGRATLPSPSRGLADPVPRLDRGIEPEGDEEEVRAPALSLLSSPGLTGGPASPTPARSGERSADPPASLPAPGGHHQETAPGTATPPPGPAPPRLPDWVDQVPGADRRRLLAMPEPIRAETLRAWARFYGFDTG